MDHQRIPLLLRDYAAEESINQTIERRARKMGARVWNGRGASCVEWTYENKQVRGLSHQIHQLMHQANSGVKIQHAAIGRGRETICSPLPKTTTKPETTFHVTHR